MGTATISIEVDRDAARVFSGATADERRKLQLLLNLRLRELTLPCDKSLSQVLDEIGTAAEAQGLTPELLESLWNDQ